MFTLFSPGHPYVSSLTQKIYKCVIAQLPTSSIAIFLKDKNNNLEFKGVVKDENVNDPLSEMDKSKVFNSVEKGDSGTPISAKVELADPQNNHKEDKRTVVVALVSYGHEITSWKGVSVPKKYCFNHATKVSKEIVSWIKRMDSVKMNSGKRKAVLDDSCLYLHANRVKSTSVI